MAVQQKIMIRIGITLISALMASQFAICQINMDAFHYTKHYIDSKYLNENREFWVSLPLHYSDTNTYNVMYVFDAEWRFNLTRYIEFDFSANNKIDKHIIVGIPHIEVERQRGKDLSFSESRMEYDGDAVDSTWYNSTNSGNGMRFYQYLTKELMSTVDSLYSTNGDNTLVGHSMGGYFCGYILSMEHPFTTLHLYDPAIWYGDGEVTKLIKKGIAKQQKVNVLITYQPIPAFHKTKIEELIEELKKSEHIELNYQLYPNETHNSLYLPSFLKGIDLLLK